MRVDLLFLCFFFSSRRRHTRFDCDWSSDVCSSDLEQRHVLLGVVLLERRRVLRLVVQHDYGPRYPGRCRSRRGRLGAGGREGGRGGGGGGPPRTAPGKCPLGGGGGGGDAATLRQRRAP